MYDISIFLPSIRTHLIPGWYRSLEQACQYHSFQVVLCGPFDFPEEISQKDNVKIIKSYSHPTKAAQIAAINCDGEYLCHVVDDGFFNKNSIDENIKLMQSKQKIDIIGLRYTEGQNYTGFFRDDKWWQAGFHEYEEWTNIPPYWGKNCHFIMDTNYFKHVGGFDCCFEYLNHACHDLQFRLQQNGSKFYNSRDTVMLCNWTPGTPEHQPIADGQIQHDNPLFREMWYNGSERFKIDLENYKQYPEIWSRRFGQGQPSSYQEMYG